MGRSRNIGIVQKVPKIWLSKKELSCYLGVSERYIETCINMNPKVKIFKLSDRTTLYNKENIDAIVKASEI